MFSNAVVASSLKCFKLSKKLFSQTKLCSNNLLNSSLLSKGTTHVRTIVASPKESSIPSNADLSQTVTSFKYLRLIKKAIREAGPIVEENEKLSSLLTRAKENILPAHFIDFAKNISVDPRSQLGLLELQCENHCHLIVQYEDIDLSVTKPHLLRLCDKYDAHLVRKDMKWHLHFEQVGMIFVNGDGTVSFLNDPKEAQLMASKIGALSVQHKNDPEGFSYWQFYCKPGKLHEMKRQLTNEGCEIEESYIGYVPKHKIVVPNSARKALFSMIVELNKIPTIDNVFTNLK